MDTLKQFTEEYISNSDIRDSDIPKSLQLIDKGCGSALSNINSFKNFVSYMVRQEAVNAMHYQRRFYLASFHEEYRQSGIDRLLTPST